MILGSQPERLRSTIELLYIINYAFYLLIGSVVSGVVYGCERFVLLTNGQV